MRADRAKSGAARGQVYVVVLTAVGVAVAVYAAAIRPVERQAEALAVKNDVLAAAVLVQNTKFAESDKALAVAQEKIRELEQRVAEGRDLERRIAALEARVRRP